MGAKLPDHLEDRSSRFRVVLQQLIKEKNFGPPQIGCMDELPLNLSPSLRDKRIGQAGILLKHHGLQGAQATVFLTMTANGKLLPPLLVLKVHIGNYLVKLQSGPQNLQYYIFHSTEFRSMYSLEYQVWPKPFALNTKQPLNLRSISLS